MDEGMLKKKLVHLLLPGADKDSVPIFAIVHKFMGKLNSLCMIAYISIFLSSLFPLSLQNARLFVSSHAAGTYFEYKNIC